LASLPIHLQTSRSLALPLHSWIPIYQTTLTTHKTIPFFLTTLIFLVNYLIIKDFKQIISRTLYDLYADVQDIHCLKEEFTLYNTCVPMANTYMQYTCLTYLGCPNQLRY
jgi:hypothetical protein